MVSLYNLLDDPVEVAMNLRNRGDVVALMDQNPAVVFVFGAERNREILSQPAMFEHDEDLIKAPPDSAMGKMRYGMVVINRDLHKRHRKLMQPAFQKSALDGYAPDIVATTRVMLDEWKVGGVSKVDDLCRAMVLAMAMKCFYGLDIGKDAHELGHLAEEWGKTLVAPSSILLPFNIPGLGYWKSLKLGEVVVNYLNNIIEKKRQMDDGQKDVMWLIMNARDDEGNTLSEDELIAQAAALFFAGHETTAITLAWTLFLLERHPAIYSALMTEIDTVLGGRDPGSDDIQRMGLLDRVIKESMRIFPAVPFLFMRVCAENTTVGGFAVPKGSNMMISPLAAHHDPNIYPEPKRFMPDRWIDKTPSRYDYLPFGAGARACIGMLFAERALRLMLPMILQRFRFSIPAGTRIDRLTRGNILHPRHGLPMRIESASAPAQQIAPFVGDIHELLEY
jgi:cytochrome P450